MADRKSQEPKMYERSSIVLPSRIPRFQMHNEIRSIKTDESPFHFTPFRLLARSVFFSSILINLFHPSKLT